MSEIITQEGFFRSINGRMKQKITRDQWAALTQHEQTYLCDWYEKVRETVLGAEDYPTIGEMIEFMGDDWWKTLRVEGGETGNPFVSNEYICDTLWGAVTLKLKREVNEV